jgi:hypothetical protein
MVDFNSMDGLQVLLVLLSSREGFFLWGIMGAAAIILIASWFADKDYDTSKRIDPTDHPY